MSFAYKLYDYRIFCVDCSETKDVRAIDETDAEREATKAAWMMKEGKGLLCPLCTEYNKRAVTRNLPSTHTQERSA